MTKIERRALPKNALLARYAGTGAHTDCYSADVAGHVTQAEFVESFYTGSVFKIERWLLAILLRKPSTDTEARQLAAGQVAGFSAWRVEDRAEDQLLMCDLGGRTRSWLMVRPSAQAEPPSTRLYFGSAVVPVVEPASGRAKLGVLFTALLGFHKLYSRILLRSAQRRLSKRDR